MSLHGPSVQLIIQKLEADLDIARREIDRLKAENAALLSVCEAVAALADGQGRLNLMMVAGKARLAIKQAKGE